MNHSAASTRTFAPALPVLALFSACAALGGCTGWIASSFAPEGASLALSSLGPEPAQMEALLPHSSYEVRLWEESFYCSDLPLEEVLAGNVREGQFLHAQLLWQPKAGRTPVHSDATNVVIRYVIVSDGKVGLYGGGGFAWPRGRPGTQPMTLVIRSSNLALLAHSEGFVDPLTPVRIAGTVSARPDEATTRRFRRGVSQIVTDALDESLWVDGSGTPIAPDQVLALMFPAEGSPSRIAASAASTESSTASR